jgi:hypothetical protein
MAWILRPAQNKTARRLGSQPAGGFKTHFHASGVQSSPVRNDLLLPLVLPCGHGRILSAAEKKVLPNFQKNPNKCRSFFYFIEF